MSFFETIELPTNKNEDYKYTPLMSLFESFNAKKLASINTVDEKIIPDGWNIVYIEDGKFNKIKSRITNDGINLTEQVDNKINKALIDQFVSDATNKSLEIKLSKDKKNAPILLVIKSDHAKHTGLKLNIEANEGSQNQMIVWHLGNKDQHQFFYETINIDLKKQAELTIIHFLDMTGNRFILSKSVTNLSQDAHFNFFHINHLAQMIRLETEVNLNEQSAHANINSLSHIDGDAHSDINVAMNHHHQETFSSQLCKATVDGKGRHIFTGKVFVAKNAQKIEAKQLSRNLLLSNGARTNVRPVLEIFADDVKCSHGASTGQLSQDELFYFESRGVTPEKAKLLLTKAFSNDILFKLEDPSIKEFILNRWQNA